MTDVNSFREGRTPKGDPLANAYGYRGGVVAVAREPLLQIWRQSNAPRELVVNTHQVKATAAVADTNSWQTDDLLPALREVNR
jgi:hypothetical protein